MQDDWITSQERLRHCQPSRVNGWQKGWRRLSGFWKRKQSAKRRQPLPSNEWAGNQWSNQDE